jgi:Trypsin-like peptidase domain
MPLVALRTIGETIISSEPLGTCFAIGDDIVVTATHVLDPLWVDKETRADFQPGVELYAIYVTASNWSGQDGVTGGLLPVDTVVASIEHDLTVLTVQRPETTDGRRPRFSAAPLSIATPPAGTWLLALGYRNSKFEVRPESKPDGSIGVELTQDVVAAKGSVQAHHVPRRDSVMVTFPALEGDYPSPSGMSGGPVITGDGRVCGVVCSAIEREDGWTSYCSLLPYLFATSLECTVDGVEKTWSLLELANAGVVPTDGTHEHLHIHDDETGRQVRWPKHLTI